MGIKHEIAQSLIGMAWILRSFKGELDRALEYTERIVALAKESGKKFYIARGLHLMDLIYLYQGELDMIV